MPLYIVKKGDAVRLVKAARHAQVESFLIGEFEIEKADAEKAAEIAGGGTKVEDATTA